MYTIKLVLVLAMWLAKAGHSECMFAPHDILGEIIPPEEIRSQNTNTNPSSSKEVRKCWRNQVQGFKLKCWETPGTKGNSYEAIIYYDERILKTWNVISCGLNLLNSLNLVQTWYGALIYVIYKTTECREVTINFKKEGVQAYDSTTPCPSTVFRRSRENNHIFSNGWENPTDSSVC